jgi:hypothetical protein
MGRFLEQEDRRRVDDRRYGAVNRASLGLAALLLRRLLAGLRLALLALLGLLAWLATNRFSADRRVGSKCRQDDSDGQFPLHAADVTTPRLNRK